MTTRRSFIQSVVAGVIALRFGFCFPGSPEVIYPGRVVSEILQSNGWIAMSDWELVSNPQVRLADIKARRFTITDTAKEKWLGR